MSKEAKYIVFFVCFIFMFFVIGSLAGCKSKGYQGLIYHEKDLIAKTSCDDELFLKVGPDTVVVKSSYYLSHSFLSIRYLPSFKYL